MPVSSSRLCRTSLRGLPPLRAAAQTRIIAAEVSQVERSEAWSNPQTQAPAPQVFYSVKLCIAQKSAEIAPGFCLGSSRLNAAEPSQVERSEAWSNPRTQALAPRVFYRRKAFYSTEKRRKMRPICA